MAESTGESLNILEDYGEFLEEYETITRSCFDNTKKVLSNISNKSNLIDLDKYILIHLKKLQSSIDFLTSKLNERDSANGEQMQAMGKTTSKFDQNVVTAMSPQFSSSLGFRDVHSKRRNNSHLRMKLQSPDQRSTTYSRWGVGSENIPRNGGNLDEYYRTNNAINNCNNIIKILFMNCEELKSSLDSTNNEYSTIQDLFTENEEHFIDLIENTERFLQDIRDSGFHPSELPPNSRIDIQNSDESNARKYLRELDSIIDECNSESPNK